MSTCTLSMNVKVASRYPVKACWKLSVPRLAPAGRLYSKIRSWLEASRMMPVQSVCPMCQEVGEDVVRQLCRFHSVEWKNELSTVAGSVLVTGVIDSASRVTSIVRVQL